MAKKIKTKEDLIKHIDQVFLDVDFNITDQITELMRYRNELRFIRDKLKEVE